MNKCDRDEALRLIVAAGGRVLSDQWSSPYGFAMYTIRAKISGRAWTFVQIGHVRAIVRRAVS